MPLETTLMVGGEAGQGVQSVGFLLAKAFARGGYHVFADQDYESRIRGGHNFFRIRVKDKPVSAVSETIDFLLALNKETIDLHHRELSRNGIIIYDGENIKTGASDRFFSIPLEKIAAEKAGDKIMSNTVALGAVLGLVGYELNILLKLLREHFSKKPEVAEQNVKAVRAGYDYAQAEFNGKPGLKLNIINDKAQMMLLNGNEAVSLGALAAGCKFMSAYPMTPATPIMEYLASKSKEFNIAVVHAEDEIAAINMAIGAAFAGARAMTATSGSGFCLMVEGLGLAGITETPVVIVDGQRPGPAVGLPTRTEQGDLQFVITAHHGEFPRAVLAPATVEDAFWLTVKAFNIAEKYQLPVIILIDHYLSTAYNTVEPFDLSKVTIERGILFSGKDEDPAAYKRHLVTESGISPRAFPGLSKALVMTDSDEHDEAGHLTESAQERTAQVQKRLRKLAGLVKEMALPRRYGLKEADLTLIGWGSTYGALREAVDILRRGGQSVNLLHFNELYPFPAKIASVLSRAKATCVVENNATGQLARLIRAETGIGVSGKVLKFDGRPFTPAIIIDGLRKEGLV